MENIDKSLFNQQQCALNNQFQPFQFKIPEQIQSMNQSCIPQSYGPQLQQQSQKEQDNGFQQHYFEQLIDINNDELLKTMLQDPISSQFVNERLNELCQQKLHQLNQLSEKEQQQQESLQKFPNTVAVQQNQQINQLENFMNVLMIQNQNLQGKVEELQQSILFPINQSTYQSNQSFGMKSEDYFQILKACLANLEQTSKLDYNFQKIQIDINKLKFNLNSLEQCVKLEKQQQMSVSENYDYQNLKIKKKQKIQQLKEIIQLLKEENNGKGSQMSSQLNQNLVYLFMQQKQSIIEQQTAEIERLQSLQNIKANKMQELSDSYIRKDDMNRLLNEKKNKWNYQKQQYELKEIELNKELKQKLAEVDCKEKVITTLNCEIQSLQTKLSQQEKNAIKNKENLQEKLEYNEKLNRHLCQQLQKYQNANENKNSQQEMTSERYQRFQELLCKLQKKLNAFPQQITELNSKQLKDFESKFLKLQTTLMTELKFKNSKHQEIGKENTIQIPSITPDKTKLNVESKIISSNSQKKYKNVSPLSASHYLNGSYQYLPIRKEEAIPAKLSHQPNQLILNAVSKMQNSSQPEIPNQRQIQLHPRVQIVKQDNLQSVQKTTYYFPAFQQISYKIGQSYQSQRGCQNSNYMMLK